MIKGLTPHAGRLNKNLQTLFQLLLADILVQHLRAQINIDPYFLRRLHAFSRKVMLAPGGQDAAVLSAPETVGPVELSAEERIVADRANSWLTDRFGPLLYSRIDIFPSPDGPLIGEVELIEPSLFFEADPPSAKRFVAVLGEAVSTGTL